ncbi:MAG: type II toxin-antitoxin system Phd/YefM family antitoxin [Nitrospira sp.]|nr:MAG: type II toxin-antitoxin system Phd/YefM family antitoxin [Nitrospira sp.]
MKLASVKDVKLKLSDYLKKAEREDMIITRNGRPTAVLHYLGEDDLKDYVVEHDPKFRKIIEKRWGGVWYSWRTSAGEGAQAVF